MRVLLTSKSPSLFRYLRFRLLRRCPRSYFSASRPTLSVHFLLLHRLFNALHLSPMEAPTMVLPILFPLFVRWPIFHPGPPQTLRLEKPIYRMPLSLQKVVTSYPHLRLQPDRQHSSTLRQPFQRSLHRSRHVCLLPILRHHSPHSNSY